MEITKNTNIHSALASYPYYSSYHSILCKAIYAGEIKNVADALAFNVNELRGIRGIGKKTISEFRDFQDFLHESVADSSEYVVKDPARIAEMAKELFIAIIHARPVIDLDLAVNKSLRLALTLLDKNNFEI